MSALAWTTSVAECSIQLHHLLSPTERNLHRSINMPGNTFIFLLLTLLPVLAHGAPTSTNTTDTGAAKNKKNNEYGTASHSLNNDNERAMSHSPSGSSSSSGSAAGSDSGGSDGVTQNSCGQWVVPGTGTFANKSVYTFEGNSLPAGLSASNYNVDDRSGGAPYNHVFTSKNVTVSGGFLNLKVPGGQKPSSKIPITSAEVVTDKKMLYGSVRTNAIFSVVPGTCHGKSSGSPYHT